MISVQDFFIKQVIQNTDAHNTTYNSPTIDIFNEAGVASKALIAVLIGDNDDAFTTLKLQGSNTDNGTDWEDVDGSVFGTDPDVNGDTSVLPGATFADEAIGWTVNTNGGAYRYYRVVAAANAVGAAAPLGIIALLGHRSNVPADQAVAMGVAQLLCVPPVTPATH